MAALTSAAYAEQALLRGHGQADGLDNLFVSSVTQDSEGYLWAGTDNGLYRFDGLRFQRTAAEELTHIDALLADPRGGLWVATPRGLYHWQAGRLQLAVGREQTSAGRNTSGNMAVDPEGHLWMLGDDQLYQVSRASPGGSGWQIREMLDKPVAGAKTRRLFSLASTRDGSIWVGCEYSLCKLEGGRLEVFATGQGALADQVWSRLLPGREGSLWLRSPQRLARLAAGTAVLADMGLPAAAAGERGLSHPLVEDAQGRILTGGSGSLARLDPRQPEPRWDVFDRSHGMPRGGRFLTLFSDAEAGVWLSRGGSGLWQWIGYGRWEHWTAADGLPHDVVWSAVRDTQGHLHVATNGGVARFDEMLRHFETSPGTAGTQTMALHVDASGQIWASAVGKVLRRPAPPAEAFATAGRSDGWNFLLYKLQSRHDGSLWFSGSAGIGRWPQALTSAAPLGQPEIRDGLGRDLCAMPAARGSDILWGSAQKGLVRLDDAQASRPEFAGSFTELSCGRQGVLYASDEHQHILRLDTSTTPPTSRDITPPLLARRQITAMLEDRRGWLWVNTDAGVAVWNGRLWRLLDQAQGLIWNDTSGTGLFEDHDGTMWISTSQGLSHLLDPQSVFEPTLPALRIRSVVLAGEPRPADGRLRLKWSRSEALEVAIESPSYRDRASQSFEHRLLGFDERWQPTGGSVIRYAGLPPGSFTLQARLVDRQLGLSSPGVEMHLEIEPPWWETWTFRLAAGLLLACLAYAADRWRLRAARQREQELAALVAERTRELEASREELRERATKDGLTGAWNRRTVLEMLGHDVERSARDRQPLTVVLADIDHFKRINDELGHPAGDEVLRQFVARLRAAVRPYDAVGRYGGEEFVVLLRGLCTDRPEDRARIGAIHAAIADGPMMLGHGLQREVTCSFGAACARADAHATPEDLIRQADEALYRAKRAGRDRVEYACVGADGADGASK